MQFEWQAGSQLLLQRAVCQVVCLPALVSSRSHLKQLSTVQASLANKFLMICFVVDVVLLILKPR